MAGRFGSVDQWAATLRISRQAAYKRIQQFQIPLRNGKLDFDEADRISEASLTPHKRAAAATTAAARAAQGSLFGGGDNGHQEGDNGEPYEVDDPVGGMGGVTGRLPSTAIARVQLMRDMNRANYEKIRLEQAQGKVVSLAEVTRFYSELFLRLRDEFSGIGAEVMDATAASSDPVECREIVDRRIEKALRGMTEWRPVQK